MRKRSPSKALLDFEISFYEKLLKAYPDFVDVLIPLGDVYTRRGRYEKGLEIDLRLIKLRGDEALTWYNLACSYSLLNRVEESLQALQRAVELGYVDLPYLQKDPDLTNARRSARYPQFIESCVAKLSAHARQATARNTSNPIRESPDSSTL